MKITLILIFLIFSVLKRNVAEAVATKAYFMSYDFSTGCYLGSLLNLYYSPLCSRGSPLVQSNIRVILYLVNIFVTFLHT